MFDLLDYGLSRLGTRSAVGTHAQFNKPTVNSKTKAYLLTRVSYMVSEVFQEQELWGKWLRRSSNIPK